MSSFNTYIARRFLMIFRNDEDKCDFICCGAAAGVAAAFGAPVGGIVFVLEEGASYLKLPLIFILLLSSTFSFLVLNLLQSMFAPEDWKTGSYQGFLSFGSFENSEWDMTQLGIFAIIGIIGGVSGALFNKINEKLTQFRMKKVNKHAFLRVSEILTWSVIVTLAAIGMMTQFADCQEMDEMDPNQRVRLYCEDGKYHGGASTCKLLMLFHKYIFASSHIIFSGFATPESVIKELLHKPYGHYDTPNLFVFAIAYFFLACYTYGLSISSGLFIPCLLIGASWGRIIGRMLILYTDWDVGDPGKYALMAAVAQLSGVVRISVCVAAIVSEATGRF